jgi:hypothetical protein
MQLNKLLYRKFKLKKHLEQTYWNDYRQPFYELCDDYSTLKLREMKYSLQHLMRCIVMPLVYLQYYFLEKKYVVQYSHLSEIRRKE